MNDPSDEIMTVNQVCAFLKCSKQTLWRMRIADTGPKHFKVMGSIRYNRKDVMAYINEQEK